MNPQRVPIEDVPVVILCGGQGTRMREETELRPKPMVEIGGKPLLWHILKSYSKHGFRNFVLAVGYKGEVIKNYFYHFGITTRDWTVHLGEKTPPTFIGSEKEETRWSITCIDTGVETLKGARIKRLAQVLKADRFHATYGDGVANVDLTALDRFHCAHGSTGTVTAVRPPSRFGEISIDQDYITHFEEKPQLGTGYINGGFFVFERRFLDRLSDDASCDLEFGALQKLAQDRELRVKKHDGFWQCMDNVRERDYLQRLWDEKHAPWI